MSTSIHPIVPADLSEENLHQRLYPNLDQTLYWSDHWRPDFYIALARAGFISISQQNPEHGTLLLPELQKCYAVLDWENLRVSRRIKRLLRSESFEAERIELRVVRDHERLLDRVLDYHGRNTTWLTQPYRQLLAGLPRGDGNRFALRGIELWSGKRNLLVAGEFGYTIGRTYTSLSGFCTRPDPRWRGFGTLQLVLLAERLKKSGFAFWNMGHPQQAYKQALGARILAREDFLKRWTAARDDVPDRPLLS